MGCSRPIKDYLNRLSWPKHHFLTFYNNNLQMLWYPPSCPSLIQCVILNLIEVIVRCMLLVTAKLSRVLGASIVLHVGRAVYICIFTWLYILKCCSIVAITSCFVDHWLYRYIPCYYKIDSNIKIGLIGLDKLEI